jgi:hypothetical protein
LAFCVAGVVAVAGAWFGVSALLLKYGGGNYPNTDLGWKNFQGISAVRGWPFASSAWLPWLARGLAFPRFYLNTVAETTRIPILTEEFP